MAIARTGPVTFFDPPPLAGELPCRLASPFDHRPPHELARRAARELQLRLDRGELLDPHRLAALESPGAGKMFGVLVVVDSLGRVGSLSAFSGMLGREWEVEGFCAPLFDPRAREAFWPEGEAELDALEVQHRELSGGSEVTAVRERLAELVARQGGELAEVAARHRGRRAVRHRLRRALASAPATPSSALHELAQESRADGAELRRLDAAHRLERADLEAQARGWDDRRLELERHRVERSRQLWQRLCSGYQVPNARGERRTLTELFGAEGPPGGAGDCAAPKLLAQAFRLGLKPLALAEFWRGAPPMAGGRLAGEFYPACRRKCGGVLPFMLEGLEVVPAPLLGESAVAEDEPRVVHEDAWLMVVEKPCGLLSVPGRQARLHDSVQQRLRRRFPEARGPLVVHRLDLDTSGLLLASKDLATYAQLQAQFSRRQVEKRYAALLEGSVAGEVGEISLPLRVDLDDRPRQIYDPAHGRPAVTAWRVISRSDGRTRVQLFPRTGRTHQLRVHAAHSLGLGSPIVGDRLYGRGGARLLLHAEALSFQHPRTGARISLESPAPF